jgi:hypothetical protein
MSKSKVERIKSILERIKNSEWSKNDHQPEMFESFPNGKKVQVVTSAPIPQSLERTRLKFWQLFG